MNAKFWHSEWTIDDKKMTKKWHLNFSKIIISCIGKFGWPIIKNIMKSPNFQVKVTF
jgi:hypothetical protein